MRRARSGCVRTWHLRAAIVLALVAMAALRFATPLADGGAPARLPGLRPGSTRRLDASGSVQMEEEPVQDGPDVIVVSDVRVQDSRSDRPLAIRRRIRFCNAMEAHMWRGGRWAPEHVEPQGRDWVWHDMECWDGTSQVTWPNLVCKRLYWRYDKREALTDVSRHLFDQGAITYSPPLRRVSPAIAPPPLPRADGGGRPASRDLLRAALAHIASIHDAPCSRETPILAYEIYESGWGNELNCVLFALARALASNRSLVILPSISTATKFKKYGILDFYHGSACQGLWNRVGRRNNPRDPRDRISIRDVHRVFSDVVGIETKAPRGVFLPKTLSHRGLSGFQWMRTLAVYAVRPSRRLLHAAVHKALPPGADVREAMARLDAAPRAGSLVEGSLATPPRVASYSEGVVAALAAPLGMVGPYAGLHVRIGDACGYGSTCTTKQRPRHCLREAKTYLEALRDRGVPSGLVFVATDSVEVVADVDRRRGLEQDGLEQDMDRPADISDSNDLDGSMTRSENAYRLRRCAFSRSEYDKDAHLLIEKRNGHDDFLEEIIVDVAMLAGADSISGSFYSNVPRLALLLGGARRYVSFDSMWCMHYGCSIFAGSAAFWEAGPWPFVQELGYEGGMETFAESSWPGKPRVSLAPVRKLLGSLQPPLSLRDAAAMLHAAGDESRCKEHPLRSGLRRPTSPCQLRPDSRERLMEKLRAAGGAALTRNRGDHVDALLRDWSQRALASPLVTPGLYTVTTVLDSGGGSGLGSHSGSRLGNGWALLWSVVNQIADAERLGLVPYVDEGDEASGPWGDNFERISHFMNDFVQPDMPSLASATKPPDKPRGREWGLGCPPIGAAPGGPRNVRARGIIDRRVFARESVLRRAGTKWARIVASGVRHVVAIRVPSSPGVTSGWVGPDGCGGGGGEGDDNATPSITPSVNRGDFVKAIVKLLLHEATRPTAVYVSADDHDDVVSSVRKDLGGDASAIDRLFAGNDAAVDAVIMSRCAALLIDSRDVTSEMAVFTRDWPKGSVVDMASGIGVAAAVDTLGTAIRG